MTVDAPTTSPDTLQPDIQQWETEISQETSSGERRSIRINRTVLIVVAISLVGAILRLIGIWWGLPQELHPDEPVIVQGALDLVRRHSFEPAVFARPDHVEVQLSYIVYEIYSHLFVHADVLQAYAAHPGTYLLLSRLVTVFFGIAMIPLAYFIGREFDRRVGFVAAAVTALLPVFVENSHYATPDIPLTAALMGVILACMRYLRKPGLASLLIACACTSIAVAIKYPGAVATAVIALVIITAAIRERRLLRVLRHGFIAVGAVVGILFFISPVLFTDHTAVVVALRKEDISGRSGFEGVTVPGNLLFYVALGIGVLGVLLVIAAVLGVTRTIVRRDLIAIPLLLSPLMWIVLSAPLVRWERWSLPMLIAPIVFSAIGLVFAYETLPRFLKSARVRIAVGSVVGVLIVSNLLVQSVALDVQFSAQDTRIALQDEFAQLGITAANSIHEGYTPVQPEGLHEIFSKLPIVDGHFAPAPKDKSWVVISSCTYGRFEVGPAYASERNFYALLAKSFPLVVSRDSVPAPGSTAFEPINDYLAIKSIASYASGGEAGCDIRAYRLTS